MSLRSVAVLAAVLAVFAGASTRVSAQHEGMPGMADTTKKKPAGRPKAKPSKASPKKTPDSTRVQKPMQMDHPAQTNKPGMARKSAPMAGASRTTVGQDMMY